MFGVVKHYFSSYAHQVSFYLIKNIVKTVKYKTNIMFLWLSGRALR